FFSSRRRHTRFSRDWSSDVCSSDLKDEPWGARLVREAPGRWLTFGTKGQAELRDFEISKVSVSARQNAFTLGGPGIGEVELRSQIGRASWRERVEMADGAGTSRERG